MTAGVSRELNLNSRTIEAICLHFVLARDAKMRCPRYRGKRSLPWIPFSHADEVVRLRDDVATYYGRSYRLWFSRELGGKMKAGSFSCDARGRWYLNIICLVEPNFQSGNGAVGIDLGLKHIAVLSDGSRIENPRHVAKWAAKLAIAQRAGNKKRVQAIHARMANARRHHLHEQTTRIAKTYGTIVVGNLKPSKLAKTRMAKSVLDAGWTTFRNMLAYKAIAHRAEYVEVDEAHTTRTCSSCQARSGPKGIAGLGIREWVCCECGAVHDRDINAAINILGLERQPLAGEMLAA